jgi:hypothetical protein
VGAAPRRLPPAWTITAVLALTYLILAPYSPDLAAASYRSDLFGRVGLSLWDNSWYGGHHLLAYSLIAPAFGSLIGPRLVAALSMTIAAGLFGLVIEGRFPARATRLAAAWLALGAGIGLLSSRVPFDLGLAIGLASLALAQRQRLQAALALAVLCSLASPVAGAFLALAYLAWAFAGPARAWPAVLTLAALAPIGLLSLAFPEGGSQPFVASAFYPALLGTIVVGGLIGREQRALRIGALLYALALTGSYLLPTAVGGNADRLGSLVAGPIVACVLVRADPGGSLRRSRRGLALLVLAPFLLYWQANAPVADFAAASSDPAVHASYYTPLLRELKRLDIGYTARPARIEVVPTVDHWEARWLAPHVAIARGWERQLDRYRNMLFYEEGGSTKALAPAVYERWLARNAISYIALPDAPLDYSAKGEARLLRAGGLSYLHEVWRSSHWRLFALRDPTPLVQPPARLTGLSSESMTVIAPRPGNYILRVHFTSYWALASGAGCVEEAPGEWTEIHARQAGRFHVVIRFSLARLFSEGPRCG